MIDHRHFVQTNVQLLRKRMYNGTQEQITNKFENFFKKRKAATKIVGRSQQAINIEPELHAMFPHCTLLLILKNLTFNHFPTINKIAQNKSTHIVSTYCPKGRPKATSKSKLFTSLAAVPLME